MKRWRKWPGKPIFIYILYFVDSTTYPKPDESTAVSTSDPTPGKNTVDPKSRKNTTDPKPDKNIIFFVVGGTGAFIFALVIIIAIPVYRCKVSKAKKAISAKNPSSAACNTFPAGHDDSDLYIWSRGGNRFTFRTVTQVWKTSPLGSRRRIIATKFKRERDLIAIMCTWISMRSHLMSTNLSLLIINKFNSIHLFPHNKNIHKTSFNENMCKSHK